MQDIRSVRFSVPYDWQRLAFDALVLPVDELGLIEHQKADYAQRAAKAAPRITWTPYDQARREFMREAEALLRVRPVPNQQMNAIRRKMYAEEGTAPVSVAGSSDTERAESDFNATLELLKQVSKE